MKDEIKSKRNGNKKQARSKSVPPANTGTENNILKRVSASTRNSMASQKSTGAEKKPQFTSFTEEKETLWWF